VRRGDGILQRSVWSGLNQPSRRVREDITVVSEGHPRRIAPFLFPQRYELPLGPAQAAPREVRFLLGEDLALFDRGMNLELGIVRESRASRYRTPALAALLGLWSRSFSYRADGCRPARRLRVVPALAGSSLHSARGWSRRLHEFTDQGCRGRAASIPPCSWAWDATALGRGWPPTTAWAPHIAC
jgi:hypothetical protein